MKKTITIITSLWLAVAAWGQGFPNPTFDSVTTSWDVVVEYRIF
jgi:hypothetical protein